MSKITGLTTGQFKALKTTLSYDLDKNTAYFSGRAWNTRKSLLSKSGEFPTGLYARAQDCVIEVTGRPALAVDRRIAPSPLIEEKTVSIEHEPYEAQLEACQAALAFHRGTICMPTGTGKSMLIAMIAARLNVKTLVVVPNLEIKKQLTAVLSALENVTVENIDSAALALEARYDCVVIDEAHHVAAKTYQRLNKTAWRGIYYRFFLTATPFRNNSEETLLFEAIAGQVIYSLSYRKAVSKGYIVPVEAYYLDSPKKKTDAYSWKEVYGDLIVNYDDRNSILAVAILRLQHVGARTLCLVREIRHGKLLSQMTGCPFVSGEDESSRDYIREFNNGRLPILIGTSSILGEGIDTRPCEYVIIAGAGKAKSQFMQQVGRAVRLYEGKTSAKVILIKDTSHKFLARHFKAQCAILREEYGVTCQKLEI